MSRRRAAVDIGTNSMRLLIVDETGEVGRWQTVTGLGRGVDADGRLAPDAVLRTISVLQRYGRMMADHDVVEARAVATSASRDAGNVDEFLDLATEALGIRPEVITGAAEAELSYRGATADAPDDGPHLVIDVGGGSTEFVWETDGSVEGISVDIGSVRLTDRVAVGRPATFEEIHSAIGVVEREFGVVAAPDRPWSAIGVAGTWTSLAAVAADLPEYDRSVVHHYRLSRSDLDRLVVALAAMTLEETARIPALDPARAPVILSGAIVAREAMRHLALTAVVVSEHDLLDGLAAAMDERDG